MKSEERHKASDNLNAMFFELAEGVQEIAEYTALAANSIKTTNGIVERLQKKITLFEKRAVKFKEEIKNNHAPKNN